MRARSWIGRAWSGFRHHSLFVATIAYCAIVLGAFYLEIGSQGMLIAFGVTVFIFVIAVLARLMNGWKLILIALMQGALVVALGRGLESFEIGGLSELVLLQITMPLVLGAAWALDGIATSRDAVRSDGLIAQ